MYIILVAFVFLMDQYYGNKIPLRIYGGEDVKPDQYPYVVRLEIQHVFIFINNTVYIKHGHLCTASALSPTWAVTAAHCVTPLYLFSESSKPHHNVSKLVIRYGSEHSSPWRNYSLSDVVAIIVHPLYTFTYDEYNHHPVMKNDIGLLKTKPILLRSYMKLSAVDFTTMYGHEAVFVGFGVTTKKTPEGNVITGNTLKLQKPLQFVDILIMKCPENEKIIPSICLAKKCGFAGLVCGGDSGGPLIHFTGIVGVLSVGDYSGFCLDNVPKIASYGRYAGITIPTSPYLEWIYSYVKT